MKCHLCGCSLTPNAYSNWELGKRKEIGFQCTNSVCSTACQLGFTTRSVINLVVPEGEISSYILHFQINDKWYEIEGQKTQTVLSKITYNDSYRGIRDEIIIIPRVYGLNKSESFQKQAENIFYKLKSLNVFS